MSFIFCLVLSSLGELSGQLVNIESKRMQTDTLRFVFIGNLSTSYNDNDGIYLFQINTNTTTQFKSKDLNKRLFLVGDYSLIRSENQDFQNTWFFHIRYNQEFTNLFRIEGFVQSQENKILDVNSRNIVGGGIRLKLISKQESRLYWGNSYMYEVEKNDILNQHFKNHRYSTYISFNAQIPNSPVSITNTLYYQPLFKDFGDYRVSEQFRLDIDVSKKVNLIASFDYFRDSVTPRDKRQYYSRTSLGIGLKLDSEHKNNNKHESTEQ